MKDSARYAKIVEWSDEDGGYVGRAPGFINVDFRYSRFIPINERVKIELVAV